MTQQRRFTKKFEDEVIRLARVSGRTQREVVEDIGHFTHRDPSLIKAGIAYHPVRISEATSVLEGRQSEVIDQRRRGWPFLIPR